MKASRLLSRSTRTLLRHTNTRQPFQISRLLAPSSTRPITRSTIPTPLSFSTTRSIQKGLQPDTEDPVPPNPEPHTNSTTDDKPAELTDSEYHEIADQYIDSLVLKLEEKAEDHTAGVEVEYSAGVLSLVTPKGTYIINKQPPNKQIWLSSPITGPKRFDWVLTGEGQTVKEGTEVDVGDDGQAGGGKWVYLRDGTTLSDILSAEVGVDVMAVEGEEDISRLGKEGPGGSG